MYRFNVKGFFVTALLAAGSLVVAGNMAFAYPAVNDYASFVGKQSMPDGSVIDVQMEIEITAFDASQSKYKQVSKLTMQGQTKVDEVWLEEGEMISKNVVSDMINNCAAIGGKLEKVEVKAGKFDTCAIPQQETNGASVYWVTDVPFGFVKLNSQYNNGTSVEAELVAFRLGAP